MARLKGPDKISRSIRYDVELEEWLRQRAIQRQRESNVIVTGGISAEIVQVLRETYERENTARISG